MKNRRKWKTASDLAAELNNDPEYLEIKARKEAKFRERAMRLKSICEPIFEELRAAGFFAESFPDLIQKYAPLSSQAVQILLAHLKESSEVPIQSSLVRALGAAKKSFDGRILVECFEATADESLRFAILNTIALVKPHSITDWLETAKQDVHLRQTLADLGYRWGK